jgi:hypothetical protein
VLKNDLLQSAKGLIPRLAGGVKGHNIKEISFSGRTALCAGSFTNAFSYPKKANNTPILLLLGMPKNLDLNALRISGLEISKDYSDVLF